LQWYYRVVGDRLARLVISQPDAQGLEIVEHAINAARAQGDGELSRSHAVGPERIGSRSLTTGKDDHAFYLIGTAPPSAPYFPHISFILGPDTYRDTTILDENVEEERDCSF
jgi:hypothetical protein